MKNYKKKVTKIKFKLTPFEYANSLKEYWEMISSAQERVLQATKELQEAEKSERCTRANKAHFHENYVLGEKE